jgi:hypothetical protein
MLCSSNGKAFWEIRNKGGKLTMELNVDEALRYLGISAPAPEDMRRQAEEIAQSLTSSVTPRYTYRLFPLSQEENAFSLTGSGVTLTGNTAQTMLNDCQQAVLLCCTLGAEFETMLRSEQARDMARAVILDACGSAWVEAGCDKAEDELSKRLPQLYRTDRFSPGYGDLPLDLQPAICAALDTRRRLGVHVTDSLLLNPGKSVTAVIGLSPRPQMARVRGCAYCTLRERCSLRKGGKHCGI